PEPLTSQFRVSHAMVLGVLSRPGDPLPAITKLLTDNHDAPTDRNPHVRRAVEIYRTLRQAGLVERVPGPDGTSTVRLVGEVLPEPSAAPARAGRVGVAGARGGGPRPGRGLGDRGDAGGPASAGVRPAARRPGRGDGGDEGRGVGVHRPDERAGGGHLPPAAG